MSNEPDESEQGPDQDPNDAPSASGQPEPGPKDLPDRPRTGRTGGLGELPGLTGPLPTPPRDEPDLPPEAFQPDPMDTPLAMPSDSASDALLNQPAGHVDDTRGDGTPPAPGGPLSEALDEALDDAVHEPLPGATDEASAGDEASLIAWPDGGDAAEAQAAELAAEPDGAAEELLVKGRKGKKPKPPKAPKVKKPRREKLPEHNGPGVKGLRGILYISVFNITDRYVLAELLKPFTAGVIAFMIIMVSNTLYIFMEQIVKSNVPVPVVLRMLLYSLPAIVVVTLPVAYMFATLLALGRLGRDSEIIALRACGVSLSRIIMPVIVMSIIISGVGFGLQEKVVPWANQQTVEILKDMMKREPIQNLKEKTFLKFDERYFYVNEIDRNINLLKQLFLLDKSKTELPQVIAAQRATREQTRWVLRNGILHKLEGTGWIDHEIRFKRMEIEMDIRPEMVFSNQPDVRSLASGEAAKLIEQKKAQGQDTRQDEMDLHTKFSLPLATFFTILLAAPIGIMFSKMGNYFGVAISIALVFIWYVTYSIFTSLGKAGSVHPVLAAWIQNIAFGGIGVMLLLQLSGIRWMQGLMLPFKLLLKPFVALARRRKPRTPRRPKPGAA